jgi:hypothetical protein
MTQGHEPQYQEPARHDAPSPEAASTAPTSGAAPVGRGNLEQSEASRGGPARSLKSHALSAILALVFGMIGAYATLHFLEAPTRPSDLTGGDQPKDPYEGGPTTKDLSDQVAKLSDRLDTVNRRIDALPKPAPPPDLSDLEVSVADMTKVTEEVGPIRDAVKRIDDRIDDLSQRIRSLGDEVHARASRTRAERRTQLSTERTERTDATATVPEQLASDEALARGAALFRQQKYKDALDLFRKLELTNSDDARVWYFAALAHGFATKQWKDDGSETLVEKGIERERAGTPPSPVIDETFKDLTSATGKDWLAAYRNRVKAR